MQSYNVIAEIDIAPTTSRVSGLVDRFDEFHPSISRTGRGTIEVIITVAAESLPQASRLAHALISEARSVEILTTADFDARNGVDSVPDLVSVSEAAELLGISRPGVLDRITRGTLVAQKVGATYVIPRAAVTS